MKNSYFENITSLQNKKIKKLIELQNVKGRRNQDAFLFEGKKLFHEALKWNVKIEEIYLTNKILLTQEERLIKDLKFCNEQSISMFCMDEALMKKISLQENPEGILIKAQKIKKNIRNLHSYVILEDVQDPGNVGTIIRTADAMGFEGVILTNKSADHYNEKVLRSAMGSVFHLAIERTDDLDEVVNFLKKRGICIYGSTLDGRPLQFYPEKLKNGFAIIVGNESKGMSISMKKNCHELMKIPMQGNAESLNVGIASGIFMYELAKVNNIIQ